LQFINKRKDKSKSMQIRNDSSPADGIVGLLEIKEVETDDALFQTDHQLTAPAKRRDLPRTWFLASILPLDKRH
jgi:hypothetical protein